MLVYPVFERFTWIQPFLTALQATIGGEFTLYDADDDGWTCLKSGKLEGGVYLLIGAAPEAVLCAKDQRDPFPLWAEGQPLQGFAVGVYSSDIHATRSVLIDHLATTADVVAQLATIALAMAAENPEEDFYPQAIRRTDGTRGLDWWPDAARKVNI